MAYATIADVKSYLGIDTTVRADTVLLEALLVRAQSAIDSHCQRTFEAASDTTRHYDHRAVCGVTLFFDGDLCSITSVVNGDGITVGSAAYTTEPRHAAPYYALTLRHNADVLWNGLTADIAVTGKWAYSATAPADVVQATVRLCAWMYRQKDTTGNDQPMIAGNVTILPARIPSDVDELLAPYVRRLV